MKYTFSLLFLIIFNVVNWAQPISFPEKWLFKTGDDSSYKEFSFNDADWQKIKILSPWEEEGYTDYNGFAWYRLHFEVDKQYLDKELYLLLGKIDDIDETYLNGILVGKSGTLPPNTSSDWNTQRIYKISGGILKEKNVLAVRVYDFFMEGGIYQGAVGIFDKEGYEKELTLGPAPKKSFFQLVTSNGLIAAIYNEKQNKIEKILPHIFQ